MNIYLDNAATTKPDTKVIETMSKIQRESWGNPSSIHSIGQTAANVLAQARQSVAEFLGCELTEVIFTSGGSESDNLAIRGVVEQISKSADQPISKPHVITSMVEHHAVLHTVQELEKEGKIEATYLRPDKDGIISPDQVIDAIQDNTVLISLMYVNNETGVITDIREIGEIIRSRNKFGMTKSVQDDKKRKIYFHTDAVQAAEWLPMDVAELGVDLLTFTGHKIHGPKGIGVLYVRKGTPVKREISGGDQEFRLRAGTENVAGLAGLAEAIRQIPLRNVISTSRSDEKSPVTHEISHFVRDDIIGLRDKLIDGIKKNIPDVIVNGEGAERAPHIANISFLNAEGEAIILNLDFLGIQVSSGSACTSRSLDPSHVLSAMGVPPEKAHGSIRFSLSRHTTEAEIDRALEVLPGIISKLRLMSPFK